MSTCRKQTVKEALAEARRAKRRALTPMEKRIVSANARQSPVLICGPTRHLESYRRRRSRR